MRLDICLINEYGGRVLGLALDLIAVLGHRLSLRRRNSGLDGELHKPLHSDVLLAGEAEDREHTTLTDSYSKAFANLVLCQRSLIEETLHKRVVKLGGLLDEFLAKGLSLVHKISRNLEVLTRSVIVFEMIVFHLEDINETIERRTWVNRELHDDRLVSEGLLHLGDGLLPVGLL